MRLAVARRIFRGLDNRGCSRSAGPEPRTTCGGPATRDVISLQPAGVCMFVALDVHKLSIVAGTLPPSADRPEVL